MSYNNLSKKCLIKKIKPPLYNNRFFDDTLITEKNIDINCNVIDHAVDHDVDHTTNNKSCKQVYYNIITNPISELLCLNKTVKVNICVFNILDLLDNKLLQYLFFINNNTLYFPSFETQNFNLDLIDVLKRLLIDCNYNIKGYILYNSEYYIIIELIDNIKLSDDYIFSSIYEIMNKKSCFTLDFDNSVISLFLHNKSMVYLKDNKNKYVKHLSVYYNFYNSLIEKYKRELNKHKNKNDFNNIVRYIKTNNFYLILSDHRLCLRL